MRALSTWPSEKTHSFRSVILKNRLNWDSDDVIINVINRNDNRFASLLQRLFESSYHCLLISRRRLLSSINIIGVIAARVGIRSSDDRILNHLLRKINSLQIRVTSIPNHMPLPLTPFQHKRHEINYIAEE